MATNNNNKSSNIRFSIDRKDVVLVKPSKPTPSEILSLSTIDNGPLLQTLVSHIAFVYQTNNNGGSDHDHEQSFCQEQEDPACIMEEALSNILVYYYPLAGKLTRQSDGTLGVNCNSDGVPFLVATANCHLSSLNYLDGIDVEITNELFLDLSSEKKKYDNYQYDYPLMFQVTKFSCGGFVIGLSLSHAVIDGYGVALFFYSLTEIASKKSKPSVKPVWERERLSAKATNDQDQEPDMVDEDDDHALATSPYLPSNDIVYEYVNVTAESIEKLKMSLKQEINDHGHDDEQVVDESLTTFEVLGAYVWRSWYRSLKMDPSQKTMTNFAVGIRQFLNPPLPEGYYGNAYLPMHALLTGKDLDEGPLSKAVKIIKECKKLASSNDYIKKKLRITEKERHVKQPLKEKGASLLLSDWRQFSALSEVVDFGWKIVNLISSPWARFGNNDWCYFMPHSIILDPYKQLDGVKVLISLPRPAIAKFKEEMEALKHI